MNVNRIHYHLALQAYEGWAYGPMNWDKKTIDCCALGGQLIGAVRGHPRWAAPGGDWWSDMMILNHDRPWSPIEATAPMALHGNPGAYEKGGLFREDVGGRDRKGVDLCQGWSRLKDGKVNIVWLKDDNIIDWSKSSRGHTWLWVWTGPGMGYVIESSGKGPRIEDAKGKRSVAQAFDKWGKLDIEPMRWEDQADSYSETRMVRVS